VPPACGPNGDALLATLGLDTTVCFLSVFHFSEDGREFWISYLFRSRFSDMPYPTIFPLDNC